MNKPYAQLTIRIPHDLHDRLKYAASTSGCPSVQDYVSQALTELLESLEVPEGFDPGLVVPGEARQLIRDTASGLPVGTVIKLDGLLGAVYWSGMSDLGKKNLGRAVKVLVDAGEFPMLVASHKGRSAAKADASGKGHQYYRRIDPTS